MNRERAGHIMTIEDPIEFLHEHKRSRRQPARGRARTRTASPLALAVLRQDPDVILVGEMRDLETISTTLTAAETGHLVFAPLHTHDAPQTIDRIVDVFPADRQAQVRLQLSSVLPGVVAQRLVPRISGGTRRGGRGAHLHPGREQPDP